MDPSTYADVVARLRAAGCVYAEEEAELILAAASDPEERRRLVARRVAGEPLEPLLGWVEFCGLRLAIRPGVFVPRQRSRLLVETAVEGLSPGSVVVDLCCGCGAIGAAVAARVPGVEVYAADVDPVAVDCAGENLPADHVFVGDLFAALPDGLRGRVDLVVANAPYVPGAEIPFMPPEARDHEPRHALDGGPDGTDLHRRLAVETGGWLAAGGRLAVETGRTQASTTAAVLTRSGWRPAVRIDDDLDATVVVAERVTRPGLPGPAPG